MTDAPTVPTSSATDLLGGVTPAGLVAGAAPPSGAQPIAPGANALSQPEDEGDQELTPPSGGATMGQQLQAKNSPFLQRVAKNANAAANSNPAAAAQPGGWARTLISAIVPAFSGLESSLGDAAAATEKVPEGGGGLTGALRTLQARNQRLTAQKQQQFQNQQEADKNKILMAESNARMVASQRLSHNLDEAGKQASLKDGQQQWETMQNQVQPAVAIAKDLTYDQVQEYLKNNKIDPTKETATQTGIKVIGQDSEGRPITALTYTLSNVPDVTLDPKNPQQKAQLDMLNENAPPGEGKKWQGETDAPVHLSGPQFNMLMQQAHERVAARIATEKAAEAAGFEEEQIHKDKEALDFGKDPNVVNALANARNVNGAPDFISARNALLSASQNPKSPLYGKYNNIDNDMRQALGYTENTKGEKTYVYDKMIEDYQKKVDAGMEQITDLQKDLDKAHGEDAAGLAETFQAKINDPNTPAPLKQRFARMRDQANAQAKASLTYDQDKKTKETEAENAANQGDMSGVMDMALKYQEDPDKLFSRFKDLKSKREFLTEIHKQDPTWSESEYKARYKTAQDFAPEGKGGLAKQSLNAFGGHIGDANSLISSLSNSRSPMLNMPLNKIKEDVLGQPQFVQYRTAIAAAADEYINFLLNQKAKHASDDDLAARLQSVNTSPAAAQAMMRQMATTIAIRARAMNKAYRDQMGGKDIPNFMDPDTTKVLRDFGIDPSSITNQGESGLIKTPDGSPPQKTVPVGARPIMKAGQTIGYVDANGNRTNF